VRSSLPVPSIKRKGSPIRGGGGEGEGKKKTNECGFLTVFGKGKERGEEGKGPFTLSKVGRKYGGKKKKERGKNQVGDLLRSRPTGGKGKTKNEED